MHDLKILEDEWKKYQLKKRKPMYIILVLILVLGSLVYFGTKNSKLGYFLPKIKDIDTFVAKHSVARDSKKILMNTGLTRLEEIILTRKDSTEKVDDSKDILVDIPVLDIKDEAKGGEENTYKDKVYLDIIETSSVNAYEDVEKRFFQSHDIDDALFLAKSYYRKGNYHKAKKWAYEVNKLNSDIEESLFIFVKSKVNLGEKNDALSILNNYIKKSNSDEAKKLLYKIKNNEL
jgi:tetratricopeptide (TPR) repeat protein